jgi:hypothetical protein
VSAITRGYERPPYPMRVASTQMNTNDSAAAMSGEPAAAEIKIQTNNTGSTRSNGRLRLTRAGRTAGGTSCGSACGRRPLLEFVERQAPVGERVAQDIYDALPLLVRRADRPVGHRRTPLDLLWVSFDPTVQVRNL